MRLRTVSAMLLAAVLCAAGVARADDPVHLQLRNGSAFDGRVAASDDVAITFKTTNGGAMRIAWKDLDTGSWLVAKKLVVDPADGRALFDLAKYAADNAMRTEAETLLERAVRADAALKTDAAALGPRLAELTHLEAAGLFDRAQLFMEKSNWYQALGRFQEVRRLEPGNALAINGIGEAYFSMRRMKEARQFIEEAIRVDPKCKDALFNRAYLELMELDFKSCLEGMQQVAAMDPAEGRFASRREVLAAGTKAGIAKAEDAWKKFADVPVVQARELVPIMDEIVKGPGFAKEYVATTTHYDLHTNVSQEYADTIAGRMELIYAEYDRRYGYEKTGESKTRGKKLRFPVIVFGTRDEYVEWFSRVLQNPALAAATGGVYVPLVKHLVFFQNQTFEETQLVAWHEGFHQYLDYYVGDVPLWFNEGQAEYYGGSRLDKTAKKISVGQTEPWRIGTLSELIVKNRLQSAEWLMRCPQRDFMRLQGPKPGETSALVWTAGDNYAASWALVHFCLEGDSKRWAGNLLAYFKVLCGGATADEAFDRVWGRTDWTKFNAAFRAHCIWLVERAIAERDGKPLPPVPK